MKARPFTSFSIGFILSTLSFQAFNACAAETKPAKAPKAAPAAPAGEGGSAPEEKPKTQAEINKALLVALKEDPQALVGELEKAVIETKKTSEAAFAAERKLREKGERSEQHDFDEYRTTFTKAQEAQKKENELRERIQKIMVSRQQALAPFLEVKP